MQNNWDKDIYNIENRLFLNPKWSFSAILDLKMTDFQYGTYYLNCFAWDNDCIIAQIKQKVKFYNYE